MSAVHSRQVARALQAAGIIDDIDTVTRIVIDLRASEPARIYVERHGDERLPSVGAMLDGATVRYARPAAPPSDPETCEHEAWEDYGGGARKCVDCGRHWTVTP